VSPIRLYDTMRRAKVDFAPADPKRVTMYVCGPTVYGRAHIGNARPAVVFDVLQRLLRHSYGADNVVYARNITDIDDKIMAAAAAEGVDPRVITDRYEAHYLAGMGALGVQPPDIAPHATDHIPQMVAMIGNLIDRKAAYAAEGHVLFDVTAPGDYGRLSRRPLDEMIAGARVEVAPYKRNPADFVMWKPSTADQPGWDSPWGRGRPGWHIECSAMIAAHLGHTIDIHGGGLDLIFPHHENELAQSSCAHGGAPLARVWMHNGFLSMGDTKMSKSLGNVVTVDALLAQGWQGEVLRLALLSAHYRQPLAWTQDLIVQSKATLDRWYGHLRGGNIAEEPPSDDFIEALSDDLNTPQAMAVLGRLGSQRELSSLLSSARMIGLLNDDPEDWFTRPRFGQMSGTISLKLHAHGTLTGRVTESVGASDSAEATVTNPVVDAQIAARTAARARKDFVESDRIRDELAAQGIVLEDSPSGTTWLRA
jgi:cysteinyl-tRNA synthetase